MARSPLKYNPVIQTATGNNSGMTDQEFLDIINSNLMDQGVSGEVLGNQQPLYDASGRMITPQYALDQANQQRELFSPGFGEANYGTSTYVAGFPAAGYQTEGQPQQRTQQDLVSIGRREVEQIPMQERAPNLAQAITLPMDSGQVDYKRDFSKSAFANMTPSMQAGLIGGIGGIAQGLIGRAKRRREQRAAAAEYRARRAEYESLDTSNLAADIQNPFAENVFEDLTVNQQAARFQEQQSAAARQNIMENLAGAAGGSGIASLAQSLANQATTAAQQASASIAQQEQRNQVLAAKGELQVQKGDAMVQQMQLAGAERARMLEKQQTETLFGMAQQRRAAADMAIAQSNAALMGGIGSIAGTVLTGGVSNLASGLTFFGGGDMVKK
tara:strand:+ start:116 stop:1273 length:1158 start_codon:yes stop_codon:yes gene_type:complete